MHPIFPVFFPNVPSNVCICVVWIRPAFCPSANFTVKTNIITLIEVQMMKFLILCASYRSSWVVYPWIFCSSDCNGWLDGWMVKGKKANDCMRKMWCAMKRRDNCFMESNHQPKQFLLNKVKLSRYLSPALFCFCVECKWLTKFNAGIFLLLRFMLSCLALVSVGSSLFIPSLGFSLIIFHILSNARAFVLVVFCF